MRRLIALLAGVAGLVIVPWAAAQSEPKARWPGNLTIGEGFGVQVKEWETSDSELDAIKAAGFGLLRFGIGWPYVENSRGEYEWERYDRFVASVRARKFRSIVILWGSHPSYARSRPLEGHVALAADAPAPESNGAVGGFARFASAAARRYAGEDIVWELWNEPDLDRFWQPHAHGDAYVRLAVAACRAVRQAVPSATIIGPASATMPGWKGTRGQSFLRTVLKSPLAPCIDGVSFHSYRMERGVPSKSPETVMADNVRAAAFVADNNLPKGRPSLPLICSEWGFNSFDLPAQQQAAYVVRTHLANLLSGVRVTVWYQWRDAAAAAADPEAHYGLVDFAGRAKPALAAVSDLLPQIADHSLVRRLETADQRDFVVLLQGRRASRKLLFWTTRQAAGASLTVSAGGKSRKLVLEGLPAVVTVGPPHTDVSIDSDGPL